MSDYFMPTQNNNSVQNESENQKRKSIFTSESMLTTNEEFQQQKQQRLANRQRYGVTVPDQIYDVFNQMLARCSTPEEANELSYKLGSACRYMEMAGDSWDKFQDYFDNVDNLNATQFPNLQDQKSRYEALSDSITIGKNNVKLGELGQKLMKAHRENDTELAQSLMAEIDAINQQNVLMADNVPRHFIMQELEAGAQSLPFTGAAAAAGVFGNFIVPGAGTAASFAVSSYLATGTEYIDMIANGSTPETAQGIALASGVVQGVIEANLGITKGIVKGTSKLLGKEVAESIAKNKLKEIENKALKTFHFGPTKKLLLNYIERHGRDVLGEGGEELFQEMASTFGKEMAAVIDGYDIPDDDAKHIVKNLWESFKGGVLGALGLGLVPGMNPARLEAYADIHNVRVLRKSAEVFASEEMFNKAQKNNPIFDGLSKEEKTREMHNVWQAVQDRMEAEANIEARKIAEIRDVGEGASQPTLDENGNEIETEANPVVRDETGKLFTQVKEDKDENGNVTGGTFLVGDRTQSDDADNRYGYIKYSQNENGDITIDNFYMKEEREGLRQEVFEEFAREHPDVNIEWNAIDNYAKDFKNELIKNNPSGEKNGLKYFTSESLNDIQAKKDFGRAVKQFFHNDKAVKYFDENNLAKIRYEQTPLTSGQVASVIALFDTMAQRDNKSFADFLSDKFEDGVFRNVSELKDNINAYNQKNPNKQVHANNVTGAFIDKDLVRGTKAVIYAAENADYLTLMHEVAHFYQATLTGKLKEEAEAAFDVQDGNWDALSKWKGDDGKLMTKKEAFAYYFQDWLTTGRVKNESWKNVFQKFAQFLAQAYTRLKNHLTFTPEIESVFEKMLGNDKSILSKALKAAQEEEGEYRAMLKRDAEAMEAQKKAEAEEAQRQAQAEREEKSSVTDFSDKETEQSTEEIEKKLDEVTNEKTENKTNAIDDALKDLPLTDEKKTEIADVLKDENTTRVEKAEAATEAASSVYDEEDGELPEMMFQIVGELGATELDASEDEKEGLSRMQNLVIAKQMEADGKDVQAIRLATGWEKGTDGKWRYEIDDNKIRLFDEQFYPKRHLTGDAEYDKIEQAIRDADYNLESIPIQDRQYWEAYNDAESEYVRQFIDFEGGKTKWKQTVDLERILDAPELFKAYPQLKKVQFVMQDLPDGVMARWENNKNRITVSPYARRNHLLHEIQHVIQDIEGFAKGGSSAQFETKDFSEEKIESLTKQAHELFNKQDENWKKLVRKYNEASINQDYETTSEISDELENDTAFNEYVDLISKATSIKEGTTSVSYVKTPEEQYRSLYGEVEARNVQHRINFTPEQRIKTLLAATEDVAKEDQIILNDAVNAYSEDIIEKTLFTADETENNQFSEQIDKWQNKALDRHDVITVGNLTEVLKALNIPDYKIIIDQNTVGKITRDESIYLAGSYGKGLTIEQVKKLPSYLANPLMVFKSATQEGAYLIMANAQDNKGRTIVAALHPEKRYKRMVINEIASVYGRAPDSNFIKQINDGMLVYIDKKNSLQWATERGLQLPPTATNASVNNNILTKEELVKQKQPTVSNSEISFQQVFHGSPHNFDTFSTESIGTGEGAQSFGWGLYFTNQEGIARYYADKLANSGKRISLVAKKDFLKSRKKALKDVENKEKYEAKIYKNIKEFTKELKQAQKAGDEGDIKFYQGLIDDSMKQLDEKERLDLIESFKKDIENINQEIKELEKSMKENRNLYTVEIPDEGFIKWDEEVDSETIKNLKSKLYDRILNENFGGDKESAQYEVDAIFVEGITGEELYHNIQQELGSDKDASLFLKENGYVGIDYPANSLAGLTNEGERNFVIFDDSDVEVVDHLLFQTQAELMDEARQFASWQDFMAYCEQDYDESQPFGNDEAWYKAFWEQAHGIAQEEEKQAEVEERKQEAEADTPEMVDRLFISYIRNNPEVVDNFVQEVAEIAGLDLGGDEWANVDEEGGRERERYAVLQDYINAELSDGNWQTAIAKVQGGHELSDYIRKRLVSEMTDSYKARDFRNLYSAVMKDKKYAVDALDTRAAEIERKLEKYPKRYYDIVAPTEDVAVTTPQRRKQIAQEMQNKDLAVRVKAGTLKLDDEVYNYLKSVEKKENDLKKQEAQLTEKIQGLYQDVGNTGLQLLINTHEKLMEQKARLNNRNKDIQRKIYKGLRMTDRYTRQTQEMTQTYHELERKYSDLKDAMIITDEVQKILDAQEQRREIREEVARLTKERYLADETKKIRINHVKQLFRKVDLAKVNFSQAQQIIAIQKLTMPNMIGGVNRWIGRNSPFLNAVLSRIVTDSEYKNRIVNYLEHVEKKTDTFKDFVESIRNAKSREDFENWGVAEREYAITYLPKENWVWELKLNEKARELEEGLHIDITREKVERQVYDADGHPVEDNEGNPVTEITYQFRIEDESLNKQLQETLGEELYNRLVNKPMVEWSTQEMEELVSRVNQLRDEGITARATKLEARKREAQKFIQQVSDAIKDTGIVINDDDPPEVVEKKLEDINKVLGKNKNLKGTEAGKDSGFKASLNRILHGYKDANVLRVGRVMDNQKEGVNVYLLYRKEDNCYNAKMRSIMKRGEVVHKVMAANKITEGDLAKSVKVSELGTEFTNDELLFFLAADKDFKLDENGKNDNYAATSRNAVCYGNMMSDTASQDQKKAWADLDKAMNKAIEKDTLTPEQRQLLSDKQLDTKPGTTAYIRECNRRWDIVLKAANELLEKNPGYNALLEAIQADYADQYWRMNEVSINEFNVGVNRVKCYVPLICRESNGDTNETQVMEDLLAINGVGKSGVNKGMTQNRQTISPLDRRPVQTGLFRTWCDSVERTEHFIAYAPYVRLLNRVYNSRDARYLRSDIEGRYGKGMLDYIDAYISEVANPNAQNTRSSGAELLHILRGKTAPAYLGWKASAIIKQGLTSPWPYMQFVNPAEYLKAAFKCNNPKMWEAIQEKSVFMKNRRMDPMNDLVDEMAKNAKNKADKFWSNFTKKGMEGLEWIDWVCVAPGWYACYEKKYNQLQNASEARYNAKMAELEERNRSGNGEVLNPSQMETIAKQELLEDIEMEAVTYADDCTRQCQPSNRLTDLAPMFKDKNEFMRAFLQFQTSLNVIWQNLRYDMPYAIKNKEYGRIVGTVLGYVLAGVFMNSVMEGVTSGADGDDDKDKQALRNLIFYATTQFTDAVPMIGSEFTNMNDQWITGKRGFMNSGTDMTPTATKLISAFTTATKGNWEKAAALTAEGIGLFMGAPVSGVKEINKLLGKPLTNGDVDLLRGLSDVYGIAGDILEE